jgi:ATP phosphoribosyltransferase regulatory subunit
MALQPASGARDLLPQDVGANRWICERLAKVYQRWGYEEVMPPSLERLDTLEAGGAIDAGSVLQVVADEPLGLRPEMTASIARAACTRLGSMHRPLRLHYSGSIFRSERQEGENPRVSELLQSGVELMGVPGNAGDAELLRLLLDAAADLPFSKSQAPTLLIGHQGLLELVLQEVPETLHRQVRQALCRYDRLALESMDLARSLGQRLLALLQLRGEPQAVLRQLSQWFGTQPLFESLQNLVASVAEQAHKAHITLQLDPSFQPQFALYDGIVLKLVCSAPHAAVAIASGGRYDRLFNRFAPLDDEASGVGFSFDVEELRQLLQANGGITMAQSGCDRLVAFNSLELLSVALDHLQQLHRSGLRAELWPEPCTSRLEAEQIALLRRVESVDWLS